MYRLKQLQDVIRALAIAHSLRGHDVWTADQLVRHQRTLLAGLVRYAAVHSRFYSELYAGLPLDDEIDLHTLPTTNKRLLMDNFDTVVTDPQLTLVGLQEHLRTMRHDEYHLGQYRVLATTGTSGLRGIFVYDRRAWSTVLANTIRWNRWMGIEPRLPRRVRICSIGADSPIHVTERITRSGDVGLFKLLHLEGSRPLSSLVEALNAFQPEVILPYPSIVALLAGEQIAGRLHVRPRVVATHSELLTAEMARQIEEAWGIRPHNHYGLTEEPHVGCECAERRGIHAFTDLCLIEVVDEEDRPVKPGELGQRYFLTNLYNRVQPVIRYEVTDMLAEAVEPCPCGRPFPLFDQIAGRAEDILTLERRQGGTVAVSPMALTICMDAIIDVSEYQVRHGPERIDLKVVPRPGADEDHLRRQIGAGIRAALDELGAVPPPLEIVFVDRIERQPRRMGKIKLVGAAGPNA